MSGGCEYCRTCGRCSRRCLSIPLKCDPQVSRRLLADGGDEHVIYWYFEEEPSAQRVSDFAYFISESDTGQINKEKKERKRK